MQARSRFPNLVTHFEAANEPTIAFLQAMMAHKLLTGCVGPAVKFDLGVHASNFSCLAAVDLGVQYGWYKGINAAWLREASYTSLRWVCARPPLFRWKPPTCVHVCVRFSG